MAERVQFESAALARSVRRHVVDMAHRARTSHVGSCLSCADILAVLYADVLEIDPADPAAPDRDRFILSKGHAGAALYAVLAERGFFDPAKLETHAQDGSLLSGHASHVGVPGVEVSTGSLGHGLGIAAGMAHAARWSGRLWRAVVLLSDGELDEGSTWEAVLFAAHHELSNLVAIVDYNRIQSLASVAETLALEPLVDKFEAFGWRVLVVDGHDHDGLRSALGTRTDGDPTPRVVIANTVKGRGVSFMEHSVLWHYRSPQGSEYLEAINELES